MLNSEPNYGVMDQKSDQREQKTCSFSQLAWFSFRIHPLGPLLYLFIGPDTFFPIHFAWLKLREPHQKEEFIGWKTSIQTNPDCQRALWQIPSNERPDDACKLVLPRKVRKRVGKIRHIIRHFFVTGCWNYGVLYSRAYNTHISYLIYFHDKKRVLSHCH